MSAITVSDHGAWMEFAFRGAESGALIVAYVHNNSTTIVRHDEKQTFQQATFGVGPMQLMRDWVRKEVARVEAAKKLEGKT